jgi:hypothetical protein
MAIIGKREKARAPMPETLQETLDDMTMSDVPEGADLAGDLARRRALRTAATATAATAAAAAAMTTAVFLRRPISHAAASLARDVERTTPRLLAMVGIGRRRRNKFARIAPWAGAALGAGAVVSVLAFWLTGAARGRMRQAMNAETAGAVEEAMVNGLFATEPLGRRP